jgi:hypothetical protein
MRTIQCDAGRWLRGFQRQELEPPHNTEALTRDLIGILLARADIGLDN